MPAPVSPAPPERGPAGMDRLPRRRRALRTARRPRQRKGRLPPRAAPRRACSAHRGAWRATGARRT
eukprot:11918748-Alexandrium_andersonii.AAC.1